jgi:hypothetical protein
MLSEKTEIQSECKELNPIYPQECGRATVTLQLANNGLRLHPERTSFCWIMSSQLVHSLLRSPSSMSVSKANHSLSPKLLSPYSTTSTLPS